MDIICKATVNSEHETKPYIGLCSTQFRFRYANHKKSFEYGIYENDTEFLKYVCNLKLKNMDFKISWEQIKMAQPKADGNNLVRRLCIKKATAVVHALKDKNCLNKQSECNQPALTGYYYDRLYLYLWLWRALMIYFTYFTLC